MLATTAPGWVPTGVAAPLTDPAVPPYHPAVPLSHREQRLWATLTTGYAVEGHGGVDPSLRP